jgi:hypothetical protein
MRKINVVLRVYHGKKYPKDSKQIILVIWVLITVLNPFFFDQKIFQIFLAAVSTRYYHRKKLKKNTDSTWH